MDGQSKYYKLADVDGKYCINIYETPHPEALIIDSFPIERSDESEQSMHDRMQKNFMEMH
jgi:hypothetical protein